MNQTQISSEKGFTLIEVLVALTIFAIGLLALAQMQIVALQGNATSQRLTAATALAEGTLENLLARPADDGVFDADVADVAIPEFVLDGGGTMRAYYSIDTTPDSTSGVFPSNVVRIDVRVEHGSNGVINLTGYKRVE